MHLTHNFEFTAFISSSFRILDTYMQCSPYAQARLRKIKPRTFSVSLLHHCTHLRPYDIQPIFQPIKVDILEL